MARIRVSRPQQSQAPIKSFPRKGENCSHTWLSSRTSCSKLSTTRQRPVFVEATVILARTVFRRESQFLASAAETSRCEGWTPPRKNKYIPTTRSSDSALRRRQDKQCPPLLVGFACAARAVGMSVPARPFGAAVSEDGFAEARRQGAEASSQLRPPVTDDLPLSHREVAQRSREQVSSAPRIARARRPQQCRITDSVHLGLARSRQLQRRESTIS